MRITSKRRGRPPGLTLGVTDTGCQLRDFDTSFASCFTCLLPRCRFEWPRDVQRALGHAMADGAPLADALRAAIAVAARSGPPAPTDAEDDAEAEEAA